MNNFLCKLLLVFLAVCGSATAKHEFKDNDGMHVTYGDWVNPPYEGPAFDWNHNAQISLQDALAHYKKISELTKKAKNVIFMMGDGMGISTITAARIYLSQKENKIETDAGLSWERLPNVALSKTYPTDSMVTDSAAAATALLCGEKTSNSIICSNQLVRPKNCSSWVGNSMTSVLQEAQMQGKWTGVVTTARLTHASPACAYASSPSRDWEVDTNMDEDDERVGDNSACEDIASQLINNQINKDIRVLLGGGRQNFYLSNESDPEYPNQNGRRNDRNLVKVWENDKIARNLKHAYVTNLTEFNSVSTDTEYLLGLFEPSHMQYELNRVKDLNEPSLTELVEKSINLLSKSSEGYFLFVEAGRIDHGHHDNLAKLALEDTLALSEAVQKAIDMTSEDDTMIIVTADHSHVFTVSGYPTRDTDILTHGGEDMMGDDGKPYGILSYANGPGYYDHRPNDAPRLNLTGLEEQMKEDTFKQDAAVPLLYDTHGGEDVAIYARGPMAHLYHGVHEENYIAHVIRYAMCIGDYAGEHCPLATSPQGTTYPPYSGSSRDKGSFYVALVTLVFYVLT
jgi:alkaline phosphatase